MTLNLEAKTPEMQALKTYLEENVSEVLAEKMNNGVRIEKDGKTLISKKTLETFMNYAHDEAKKLVDKGARYACIKSDVVFGWAIHYFEEDSIEGTLFNENGSEYKPAKKQAIKTNNPVPAPIVSKKTAPPKQYTFFDLMQQNTQETKMKEEQETPITDLEVDEETGEILNVKPFQKRQPSSLYQNYLNYRNKFPQHILAYRVGDFYEFFGDDAILLSNYLNLTLTGRDCGLEERVAMVGVPYHAADRYFSKITEQYPLAIVDNDNVNVVPVFSDEDDSIDDELTEEEMRAFDGDINETIPEKQADTCEDTDETDDDDMDFMKYIDKAAFHVLLELLDDKLDVQ